MAQTRAHIAAATLAIALATTLVGCSAGTPEGPTQEQQSPSASSDTSPSTDAPAPGGETTMEQAGTIATDKFGGTVTSIEDDSHQGELAWEVDLRDSTEGAIDVKVSKATGEILHFEQE